MSILSGFLSGCHSRKSKRNSFARCSLGSTFFSTVSFASTCFLAWAISGGSLTGAACATTTAPPGVPDIEGPSPALGGGLGARCGGELRRRLERLRRFRLARLPVDEELLEELDLELRRDFLDRLLLDLLLPSLGFEDHRAFVAGDEKRWGRRLDRRLLLLLLFELLRDDLFADLLVAADLSDSESSESRNFFGGAAPRHRRSFLP